MDKFEKDDDTEMKLSAGLTIAPTKNAKTFKKSGWPTYLCVTIIFSILVQRFLVAYRGEPGGASPSIMIATFIGGLIGTIAVTAVIAIVPTILVGLFWNNIPDKKISYWLLFTLFYILINIFMLYGEHYNYLNNLNP